MTIQPVAPFGGDAFEDTSAPKPSQGEGSLRLDLTTSPFNAPLNAYPDAEALSLKQEWGRHEGIPPQCICFCHGTETALDWALRIYCKAGRDNLVTTNPSRSVYERRARLHRVDCRFAALDTESFALRPQGLMHVADAQTRLFIVTSPGSPTGVTVKLDDIEALLKTRKQTVIVDEAYIDFQPKDTALPLLNRYDNLIILRSFSHAWAAAALRLTAVVAHPDVIKLFEQALPDFPLSSPVLKEAMKLCKMRLDVDRWSRRVIEERVRLQLALKDIPGCLKVYPSAANFLLTRWSDADYVAERLADEGIMVRRFKGHTLLSDCLRFTVGLPTDNSRLLGALRRLEYGQ